MEKSELHEYINLFRTKAEQRKLVIFVGAGVSRNVEGMPNWDAIIQKMADAISYSKCSGCRHKKDNCENTCLLKNDFSTDEYLKIPQYVYNQDSELYSNILNDCFPDKKEDAPLSSAILDINPAHIITTNYDQLIETSTNEFCEQYQVIVYDRDLLNAQKGKYIIKMHGDLSRTDSIVLKEQDYLDYSQKHILIELFIKSLLTDHIVLFLGYSLNDYNIKLIISWLNYMRVQNDALSETQKVGYIVLDQEEIDETQYAYFNGNNIEVINIREMPLIDTIPDSLCMPQGKRLYSFLRTIADASLEKSFLSIVDAVKFMYAHTFVDYKTILKNLHVKQYSVVGFELHLYSVNDYSRLIEFLDSTIQEALQLKQLFINAGILKIRVFNPVQSYTIGGIQKNLLLQSNLFTLYLQDRYDDLKMLLDNGVDDIIEKYFYESIILGYSNAFAAYDGIDFSSLNMDQKVAYLHNLSIVRSLKTYEIDTKKLTHYIQNIPMNRERELYSAYLDIISGNNKKLLDMKTALSKLKDDTQAKHTIFIGSTSISQIYKMRPLVITQYFFYFFNCLFFKTVSDLPHFFRSYIEAVVCANSEDAERPSGYGDTYSNNSKYPIDYIDIDIITKFINTDELYNLFNSYNVTRLSIDANGVSFITTCFANLCTSIVVTNTYGYSCSSITTLANLAIILNLVDLSEDNKAILKGAINKILSDKQAIRIIFSIKCPCARNTLKAISTLCRLLTFDTNIIMANTIISSEGFFDYAINANFSDLRNLILSFVSKSENKKNQKKLQAIIESVEDFQRKVILLRLFYSRISAQEIKDYYINLLSSQFSNLSTSAIYDLVFSKWFTPSQETLKVFLDSILELEKNSVTGVKTFPDHVEQKLECAYLLCVCDILNDITILKGLAPERPHLQFLLNPDAFDYTQVDFSDYMWVNFATKKSYMAHFLDHKDMIIPLIKERIKQSRVSLDEQKILYGFFLDGNEIWKN